MTTDSTPASESGPIAARAYNYDPELASVINIGPLVDWQNPAVTRTGMLEMTKAMSESVDISALDVTDRTIPGPNGAPDVPIRIYMPKHRNGLVPGLIYLHGGGFVIGNLYQEHATAAMIATQLGIAVISVDYRLAPENPFPAGLEDCYATLVWMHANASELNIDTNRIGVCGDSAGGGLAAALSLLSRDRGGPCLCFQYLVEPELDDRFQTESMNEFINTPLFNRPYAELSWKHYLGESIKPDSANVSVYAAPARATNLSGLPPAFIRVNEFDPLRDEGIAYAQKLLEAGVPVELHCYPGTFHGSLFLYPTAAVSQRQEAEMLDVLRRGLGLTSVVPVAPTVVPTTPATTAK